jgi:Domain of unknown function (DUF4268)
LRAQPNDWQAIVSTAAKATSEGGKKAEAYRSFWARFIDRVRKEHPGWTNAKVAGTDSWITMRCPIAGALYGVSFATGSRTRAELYIDSGDAEQNSELFEHFAGSKSEIEAAFGQPLSWEDLPDRRACRIAIYGEGDVLNLEEHDQYIDWMFDRSGRMRTIFEPLSRP